MNKQWLQFDADAEEAESLLRTKYHVYEHKSSGKINIACDEYGLFKNCFAFLTDKTRYHVPAAVKGHVDYITPGIKLFAAPGKTRAKKDLEKRTFGITGDHRKQPPIQAPLPMPFSQIASNANAGSLADCSAVITPPCVRALYNITKPTKAAEGNELGIFESIADVYDQTDLNSFFASLAPQIPNNTAPTLDSVDGATAPDPLPESGAESLLDFSLAYPIIYPQGTILFQTDDDVYQAEEANGTFPYGGFLNTFLGKFFKGSFSFV